MKTILIAVLLSGCGSAATTYPAVELSTPTWVPFAHPSDASVPPFAIEDAPYFARSQALAADICKENGWHLPALSEWTTVEQSIGTVERADLEWFGIPSQAIESNGEVMEGVDPSASLPWRCAKLLD